MRWRCLLLSIGLGSFSANACVVSDDLGRTVSLNHAAKRIVSLAPDLTEMLFAAGAGHAVVGVMQGSDYPKEAQHIEVIGHSGHIDSERLFALHPDLIVTWSAVPIPSSLQKLHIPIYTSHPAKLTDIPKTMQKLGCLAGTESIASLASDRFLERYRLLKKTYAMTTPVTVFYQVWPSPLLTITHQSWIDDVMTLCHGKTIFAGLPGVVSEVTLEAVLKANPDVIIATGATKQWLHWPELKAVQRQAIFVIDADLVERAGPRLIDGAMVVCQQLDKVR